MVGGEQNNPEKLFVCITGRFSAQVWYEPTYEKITRSAIIPAFKPCKNPAKKIEKTLSN